MEGGFFVSGFEHTESRFEHTESRVETPIAVLSTRIGKRGKQRSLLRTLIGQRDPGEARGNPSEARGTYPFRLTTATCLNRPSESSARHLRCHARSRPGTKRSSCGCARWNCSQTLPQPGLKGYSCSESRSSGRI